jgi:DNA polymerase/3'-5' exonuclease PolX
VPAENIEIAAAFAEIADLLELQDANPFRVRAYRNAVRTIDNLTRPLAGMVAAGEDLTELHGIGEDYGAALHYFTGSKAHNIAIRRMGQKLGLKINEYGVYRGKKRIGGKTEEEVFEAVGLPWIPPELREDRGEIAAAAAGRLPALVQLEQIRGDLHVHTKATDGRNSLEEMAEAAEALGYEYLAITDHCIPHRASTGSA